MKTRSGVRSALPLQARINKARLLLHLLTAPPRNQQQTGSIMVAGMLVILALLVGTLGLVAIVNGSNLASFGSGESRDAQQVAEAGADQIIATFNQPQNRQLLVAGSTPPNQWSTTNTDLQSPCVSTAGLRPGGTGLPSARAVNFANGEFRNLEDVDQVNQGNRRFVLRSVRYSAGNNGSTDRRSVFRTFRADGTALSQGGTIPTGTTFNSLLNLDDPDGGNPLRPGTHTGFIALTVEGRLYRPDGTFSSSTVTKEFEVLPKCCGGSFGSSASGGNTSGTADPGALGADSRFCGIEFGMITGINGGRFLSQAANDRYTRRNLSGQVVNIGSILGIIDNPSYVWDRNTNLVVAGRQVGCRTVPCPLNTSTEIIPGDTSGNSLQTYQSISSWQNPIPSVCPPAATFAADPRRYYGNSASIQGRAASCIPIVPLFLSSGLPSVASKYTYSWTTPNAVAVSNQTVTSASPGGYPQIVAGASDNPVNIWIRANGATAVNQVTPGPFLEYCNTRYLPGGACASVFNGSNIHTWAVISQGGAVSTSRADGIAIGDVFDNATVTSTGFSGYAIGSTPRWPSIWTEGEQTASDVGNLANGDLIVRSGQTFGSGTVVTFRDVGTDQGTTLINRPAIARAVNLYALQSPVLEFSFRRTRGTGAGATAALRLDYSSDGTITTDAAIRATGDAGWIPLASVTADGGIRTQSGPSSPATGTTNIGAGGAISNGAINRSAGTGGVCSTLTTAPYSATSPLYTCRIQLPPAATSATNRFSHYVKFRLRANSNLGTGTAEISEINLTKVEVKSLNPSTSAVGSPTYLNWCEYSSTFPVTASFTGGFHCLGPSIDVRSLGNNLWMDTTDHSITFYYNRSTDSRGIDANSPLINLFQGGTMSNVICSRANPTTTVPTENCKQLVSENVFNPVGEYDRFNIFGRDTSPASTCVDAGQTNQPCNQIVIIGADSAATSTNRSRIAGAWFYMPWGLVSFCVNGCGSIPSITDAFLQQDDSWNFGGRLWVRTILAAGQNHFRVPPSASSSLTQLVGAANSSEITYIGWEGIDWVARAPTSVRRGFTLN